MQTVLSPRRALTALGLALVSAAAAAAPAQAAPEWIAGTIENSVVANCNWDPESGIFANAEFYADTQNLPRVGEVFYVRTIPARVGGGCGVHMSVHIEVVPPVGVTPAISAQNPVRCIWWDYETDAKSPAEGCPQASSAGMHGLAFDQKLPGESESNPWPIPYGMGLIVEIPMKSSRTLAGPTSQLPSCGRRQGDPPCRPDQSGDHLQFANWVIDGNSSPWLSPYVGLSVRGEGGSSDGGGSQQTQTGGGSQQTQNDSTPSDSSGNSTPEAGLIASAPRSASIVRLRRGLPIAVRVQQADSRVTATLSLRGRVVAKGGLQKAPAGTGTVRVRRTAAGARALRRVKRSARAVLSVRVTRPDGTHTTTRTTVRLTR